MKNLGQNYTWTRPDPLNYGGDKGTSNTSNTSQELHIKKVKWAAS